MRRAILSLVCGLAILAASATPAGAVELIGSLHEHSGYSDGWVGSRPADFFASGKDFGLDFMGGSDHSDNLALPASTSQYCLEANPPPACVLADPVNPADSFRKWDATQEQAAAATSSTFTAFRGFEWTSDRFGHISVYFSKNNTNAKVDGGYVAMETFWQWLTNPPPLGGGGDGIATFNHPDAKGLSDDDPGKNWNDFAYVPAADRQMVGIELFNDHDGYDKWYPHALDAGWHVGAVGAEDLGHRREDDWGGPSWGKTVIDSSGRSPAQIEQAMLARHFYAVRNPAASAATTVTPRMSFTVDGESMGSRISATVGDPLEVEAAATGVASPHLELVTSGGAVVASADGTLSVERSASLDEDWYFVRVTESGEPVAYSSPIWIEGDAGPITPEDPSIPGDPTPGDPTVKPDEPAPTGGGAGTGALKPRIVALRSVRNVRRGAGVRVASLRCGSQPCHIRTSKRARVRIGDLRMHARVRAPRSLERATKAPLRLRFTDAAMPRLGGEVQHARLRVTIRSASGGVARKLRVRIRGPRGRG